MKVAVVNVTSTAVGLDMLRTFVTRNVSRVRETLVDCDPNFEGKLHFEYVEISISESGKFARATVYGVCDPGELTLNSADKLFTTCWEFDSWAKAWTRIDDTVTFYNNLVTQIQQDLQMISKRHTSDLAYQATAMRRYVAYGNVSDRHAAYEIICLSDHVRDYLLSRGVDVPTHHVVGE